MEYSNSGRQMSYLITGASRGIGRGLSRILLSKGYRVFLLDSNEDELQNTLSRASSWSNSKTSFQGAIVDLADRTQIKKVIGEVATFFDGKLDVLINNAFPTPHTWAHGKGMEDDLDDESIMQQWDTKLAVGLTAPFYLSRLCIPLLKAAGANGTSPGCIINICSTRAKQAEDNHEGYSAVKGGILGLTQSMAISLGHRYHIRVNAISPGWVGVENENKNGDENNVKWEEELTQEDHEWHPAGRVGKVDDVGKAVMFLVDSDFMTGEELILDGGVTKKMVYPE